MSEDITYLQEGVLDAEDEKNNYENYEEYCEKLVKDIPKALPIIMKNKELVFALAELLGGHKYQNSFGSIDIVYQPVEDIINVVKKAIIESKKI